MACADITTLKIIVIVAALHPSHSERVVTVFPKMLQDTNRSLYVALSALSVGQVES